MSASKKIWDKVYQIGGGGLSDASDCSVYIVDIGSAKSVLIDSGAGESFNELRANIETIGLDVVKLEALILTHCHIDHIGSAKKFKNVSGCKIVAHEADVDAIEGRDNVRTAARWYGVDYESVKVDSILNEEKTVMTFGNIEFNFIHTPGHTPGSISIYCDISGKRVLFGQDIHGPFDVSFGSNIDDWRKSMQKLLNLDADILCEGHFGVYQPAKDVKKYIEDYLSRF